MHLTKRLFLAAGLALLITLAGCDKKVEPSAMPDVTGQPLDAALKQIKEAGFDEKVKVAGGGLFGIRVKSNWTVCEQLPSAGDEIKDGAQVSVKRSCGDDKKQPAKASHASVEKSLPRAVPEPIVVPTTAVRVAVTAPPTTAAPRPVATTPRPVATTPKPVATTPKPAPTTPPTSPAPASVYYANCDAARAAGAAPIARGEPGYRSGLDRDNDGTACDA